MVDERTELRQAWRNLLEECALAENYHLVYQVSGSRLSRNPIVEQLLPSFAYLRVVSLAHEGLALVIGERNLTCSHLSDAGKRLHAKEDLYNRIECLSAQNLLPDGQATALHRVRERRKGLAHEGHPAYASWQELKEAIAAVQDALATFGMVDKGVQYEVVATQHSAETIDQKLVQRFTLSLYGGGRPLREIGWCIKYGE